MPWPLCLGIPVGLLLAASIALGQSRPAPDRPAPALEGAGHRSWPLTVPQTSQTGFTRLPSPITGITFTNLLGEQRRLTNQVFLNGSGLAAGDVDGDGRCDLYFCGLDAANALYRNLGNWCFTNITASAGVACT